MGITSCLRKTCESMLWPGIQRHNFDDRKLCSLSENSEVISVWTIYVDYLLILDSYSDFTNFKLAKYLTSKSTLKVLKDWFSVDGIPRILETDNASDYSSAEFEEFSQEWMLHRQTSSTLYPKKMVWQRELYR